MCFPYAGGGGAPFRRWLDDLPGWVELWTADLPGRERRISEPAADRIDSIVAGAVRSIDALDAAAPPLPRPSPSVRPATPVRRPRSSCSGTAWARSSPSSWRTSSSGWAGPPRLRSSCRRPAPRSWTTPTRACTTCPTTSSSPPSGGSTALPRSCSRTRSSAGSCCRRCAPTSRPWRRTATATGPRCRARSSPTPRWTTPSWPRRRWQPWSDLTSAGFELRTFPGGHFFLQDDPGPFVGRLAADLRLVVPLEPGLSPRAERPPSAATWR